MKTKPKIVIELAKLLASHQVLPFLGAGCSAEQLSVDWNEIRNRMAEVCGVDSEDHLEVASAYVSEHGKDGLRDFLVDRLQVESIEEERVEVYLGLLAIQQGTIYTTNQDNVLEKLAEETGRNLSVVVNASDLPRVRPGDTLLLKYHGDLADPDSIVFTKEDYDERIRIQNHPLDISLRYHALSRSLVFIGYSFRDPNIRLLFRELRNAFGGELPPSYLIQYESNDDFASELKIEYGIESIDCATLYPGSPSESFSRFWQDVCRETVSAKAQAELEQMFRPSQPPAQAIATKFEVEALQETVAKSHVTEAIRAFRAIYDGSLVRSDLCSLAARQFELLCDRSDAEHAGDLQGALFNLHLENPQERVVVFLAGLSLANKVPANSFIDSGMMRPKVRGIHSNNRVFWTVAIAAVFHRFLEGGIPISKSFYNHVSNWGDRYIDPPARIPEHLRASVEAVFEKVYTKDRTTLENPLRRAQRLENRRIPSNSVPHADTFQHLVKMLPKRFAKPYHE